MAAFQRVRDDRVKEFMLKGDEKGLIHADIRSMERVLKALHHFVDDGVLARNEMDHMEKTRRK